MLRTLIVSFLSTSALCLFRPLHAETPASQQANSISLATLPSAINEKAKFPQSVFDSLTPPQSEGGFAFTVGDEEFAWDRTNSKWLSLPKLELQIKFMRLTDDVGTVVYLDALGKSKIIYQWKGVLISTNTGLFPDGQFRRSLDLRELKKDTPLIDVDPPVQFFKDKEGKFYPCYRAGGAALIWKNVAVPESQVPKESVQHRWPILEPGNPKALRLTRYEIDIPEHMVPLVKQWIVKPSDEKARASSQPASTETAPAAGPK